MVTRRSHVRKTIGNRNFGSFSGHARSGENVQPREFASEEPVNGKFLRQRFLDLYRQVFGPSAPTEANSEELQ
jgi:hypothetical protein